MKPAAKEGDTIVATDIHLVITPNGIPLPTHFPFVGRIDGALAPSVLIAHKRAAVLASTATNTSPHIAVGGTFEKEPSNRAVILVGSSTVLANHRPLARDGDVALTCNDPRDQDAGRVVATGTVLVGK